MNPPRNRHNVREALDIEVVRTQTQIRHVNDADALDAFSSGECVFDVDPHCRKLDAFVAKNKLQAQIETEEILPCANPEIGNRPAHYARAVWTKRKPMHRPHEAA